MVKPEFHPLRNSVTLHPFFRPLELDAKHALAESQAVSVRRSSIQTLNTFKTTHGQVGTLPRNLKCPVQQKQAMTFK
ncbi:hypothetical protein CFIMG_001600RA [Ceratocystis fimbriata CBS 114723]|uniref:Uncharacterized protein n=1 Tax=Ceratocystis fimbriata CBS 114723 TaxID=1035309 RepID=A0A2C5X0M7_9PEZI|nr:hypothetical protein CFIMG_001600RA [Ceratocystis fimbriata CBS 114723]